MNDKLRGVLITTGVVASLGVGGAAIARATGGGEDKEADRAITGNALGKARAAALEHTGGGKVTETEVGDEEGAYEVEVTRSNGSQVDVHLDRGFNVTSQADDNDRSGEDDGPGDD